MKILVYGMQSSGASLYTLFLLQNRDYIGIIDLYSGRLAPRIDEENFVLKCTVTANLTLEQHKAEYKPDCTILVVRNPAQNMLSLVSKPYHHSNGTVEEKFKILDGYLRKPSDHFDAIIKYDEFILGDIELTRTVGEVVIATCDKNEWCRKHFKKYWGTGNIHRDMLDFKKLKAICPNSFELFS